MLRIVAGRLRSALGMIEELSFSTVRTRLAAYLLRTATPDKATVNAAWVLLPASYEIAAQIGTVRELVSRNLRRLRLNGVIRINGRKVHIPDVRLLAKEIEGAPRFQAEGRDRDTRSDMKSRPGHSERRIHPAVKPALRSVPKSRAKRTA